MKIFKLLTVFALATIFFTSCEKSEEMIEIDDVSNVIPESPEFLDLVSKGSSDFYTQLESLDQLEGTWKLKYQWLSNTWQSTNDPMGVDESFFGPFHRGISIFKFVEGREEYSPDGIKIGAVTYNVELYLEALGTILPRRLATTYPYAKTDIGISIGRATEEYTPDGIKIGASTENVRDYHAYTCWNGKGLMFIKSEDGDYGIPHFFIKE